MKKSVKQLSVFAIILCMLFSVGCDGCNGCNKNKTPTENQDEIKEQIADTQIVLANENSTDYSIVKPANATAAETYAAELLSEQFKIATGATISIQTDEAKSFDSTQKVISVGRTTVLEESGLSVTVDELSYDGYKLQRYGNTVVLCGAEDSGTIFSVGDFLHYQFNYESYAASELYIEKTPVSYVKDYKITEIPDFWGRETDGYMAKYLSHSINLRMRNRGVGEHLGYGASQDYIPSHCESFYKILPKETYQAEHPEWYSTRQLCLVNEEMTAEFIKNLKQFIVDNPNGKIVNLGEEDLGGFGTCCDACQDEISRYGISGYVIRFCNKVITAIESWLEEEGMQRNFDYIMFAYTSGSLYPPVTPVVNKNGETTYKIKDESCRPHEKLCIRLAPLDPFCYQHEFTDETCKLNASFKSAVDGWCSITNKFYVWDYAADYRAYLPFYNMFGALQKNLQWYKEIGVVQIFRQDTTGEANNSFSELRAYLTAKLMWDVNADVPALMDDFFDKFYKSGSGYMREYFNLMQSHCMMLDATLSGGYHKTCYFEIEAKKWPIRVLEKALDLIAKAEATYEPLKTTDNSTYEKLKLRTLKESVCIRAMILVNYGSYYNIEAPRYQEMKTQFQKDAEKVGIVSWNEKTGITSWFNGLP